MKVRGGVGCHMRERQVSSAVVFYVEVYYEMSTLVGSCQHFYSVRHISKTFIHCVPVKDKTLKFLS